jgi:hypothetical protein
MVTEIVVKSNSEVTDWEFVKLCPFKLKMDANIIDINNFLNFNLPLAIL